MPHDTIALLGTALVWGPVLLGFALFLWGIDKSKPLAGAIGLVVLLAGIFFGSIISKDGKRIETKKKPAAPPCEYISHTGKLIWIKEADQLFVDDSMGRRHPIVICDGQKAAIQVLRGYLGCEVVDFTITPKGRLDIYTSRCNPPPGGK